MFEDRIDAGKKLCHKLKILKGPNIVIVAIPRGGVVVAYQIARQLKVPLGLVFIKKLRSPTNRELAIGAVGSGNIRIIDWTLMQKLDITAEYIEDEINEQLQNVEEREKKFKAWYKTSNLRNKTVILVDDGIATGATIAAAIKYVKSCNAKKIIIAVPVIAIDAYNELKSRVDKIITLELPKQFGAVGAFYKHFAQVTDEEVLKIITNIYQ